MIAAWTLAASDSEIRVPTMVSSREGSPTVMAWTFGVSASRNSCSTSDSTITLCTEIHTCPALIYPIIEFDKKEIKFSSDLPHVVGQLQPKSKAKAKIIRDGDEIELKFTLGELPTNQESFVPAKLQGSSDPIGIKVAEIDRDNPSMANLPEGVIVSRVNPGSPASGRVNRGDLITMIQYKGKKYQVFDVESYEESIENFSSGDKIALHLNRNGSRLIRSITIN